MLFRAISPRDDGSDKIELNKTTNMRTIAATLICLASILNLLAEDRFYIEDFNISPGETKQVSIMLDNDIEYTALQADIMLPDGLTVAMEDDEYIFGLTERKTRTHTVSSNLLSSGAIRILIASPRKTVFTGNSGALVTFDIIADANLVGPKVITLNNVIASETSSTTHALPVTACSVTVVKSAESLELDKTAAEITEGETLQLAATVLPEDASDRPGTGPSRYGGAATVDANGLVPAVAPGTATITATTNDGSNLTAACAVTVKPAVVLATSVTLNETTAEVTIGETLQLTATVAPENASNPTVTWSSSDDAIATVDANGLVTAVAAGTAIITASTNDGSNLTASCEVTVKQLAVSLTLDKTAAEVTVGETLLLNATVLPDNTSNPAVTWASSNDAVATVDANGLVTAVAAGTATITATTTDGSNLTASCEVTVKPAVILVNSIVLDKTTAEVVEGGMVKLTATVLPEDATDKSVTWTTSDATIATVNEDGLVTAVAPGTVTITVSAKDGSDKTATCEVTVLDSSAPHLGLKLSEKAFRLQLNQTHQVTVVTEGVEGVIWSSSDTSIASVDASGVVTAHKNGIAIITATAANGATMWCAVYSYLRGDVDESNSVDVTDVNQVISIILGKE